MSHGIAGSGQRQSTDSKRITEPGDRASRRAQTLLSELYHVHDAHSILCQREGGAQRYRETLALVRDQYHGRHGCRSSPKRGSGFLQTYQPTT